MIQLGQSAIGAAGAIQAGAEAIQHASAWLTIAWTANGKDERIAAASKEMPMIDVYAPAALFPADADPQLVRDLTHAVLRAEGVTTPGAFHLENTAAFIHRLPPAGVGTAAQQPSPVVRVQIVTPPGSLRREVRSRSRRKPRRSSPGRRAIRGSRHGRG